MPSVEEFWELQLAHPEMVLHPLKARDKVPLIPGWQKLQGTPFSMANEIKKGCNIGLVCGKASNITAIDLDSLLFQDEMFKGITELNTLRSRRTEGRGHIYFKYNPNLPASKHHNLGIEVMSDGNNIVIPPSIHPSGDVYKWNDINAPIIEMPKLIEDNLKTLFNTEMELKQTLAKCRHCFKSLLTSKPSISGGDGHEYMLAISADIKANGGTEDQIIMLAKVLYGDKYDRELTLKEWRSVNASMTWSCDTLRAKLPSYINLEECAKCQKANKFKQKVSKNNGAFDYIDRIIASNPIYYDKSCQFWMWVNGCYVPIDKTDLLLTILKDVCDPSIIMKEFKGELIEAAKLRGRDANIKPVPNTWIHTKSGVYDLKTQIRFAASPEYFFTRPINHNIGDNTDTPLIDKLLGDWSQENKQMLYELLAYCMIDDYPIHRMFLLFGSGRNGKSQFLELVSRFVGIDNTTSTELEKIMDSRFEASKLYRKKVALIGETNFAAIKSSDRIKKITGHDLLTAEFKGKDPFDFQNTAKILIATNSIPETLDKTEAFHSRCIIIEFKNRFDEGKSIIDTIPEHEYENLLAKCLSILPNLLSIGKFSGEGTIEDKARKYESLSDIWGTYFNKCLDTSDVNADTPLWIIYEDYLAYCSKNGLRKESKNEISRKLRNSGYGVNNKTVGGKTAYYVEGVKITQITEIMQVEVRTSIRESVEKSVIPVIPVIDKPTDNESKKLHPHTQLLIEAEEWIKSHGPINSSNVTEVTLWYCGRHPEIKNPSEIKTLLEYKYATTKRSEKIKAVN